MNRFIVFMIMLWVTFVQAQNISTLYNFRIEGNQPSRVYFDSKVPISGSSSAGFVISGKTIKSLHLSSAGKTGHYFTVSETFTFWDNNTIRYEGGSNLKDHEGSDLAEFTMCYIKNEISEPSGTGKIYFVNNSGNDDQEGTSESKAWRTIAKAAKTARSGDIVFIKAGNYQDENIVSSNNGNATAPIKFIGYKSTPGDLDEKDYYRYGDGKLDGSRAPIIRGNNRLSGAGWTLSGRSYIIIKNIQIENYKRNILGFSAPNNLVFDNLVLAGSGEHNVMLTHVEGHHLRFNKVLSFNGMVSAFMIGGDFNAIINSKTYADEPEKDIAMDYHIYLFGSDNIIYNHYGQHVGDLSHAGHGIALKSSGKKTEYNLIENCELNNINGPLEFRHSDVKYNVAKNFRSDGGMGSNHSGGIVFRDGASFNIVENSTVKNTRAGYYGSITFLDRSEDGGYHQRIEGNIVRNSVFINPKSTFIMLGETTSSSESFDIVNNKIYNCIFYNGNTLFTRLTSGTVSGNELVNSVIMNTKAENKNSSSNGFEKYNNNFFAGFQANLINGNLAVDPKFENPSGDNFHLKPDSPMIDKGKDLKEVKTDFEGSIRPMGKSTDIGVYEYHDKTSSYIKADAGKDQSICSGTSATLTASGGTSYQWSTGETTQSINVSPSATSTYTVTVSDGTNSASDSVVVTVNEVRANAGQDISITAGENATLTATGGDSYLWSTGETTETITISPMTTTTYEVTVNQNGCESKDTVRVTVNSVTTPPTTVTADAGKDQSICSGNSATLTASGGMSYQWSTGETTASITVNPTETTTYTVTVSDGTSSDTDEVVVTVNSAPQAKAGSNRTIEQGETIVLTATGGDTYQWNTGETTPTISVSPMETSTYSVVVSKNGCTSSDQVKVSVVKPTPPPVANAGDDLTICKGESITLTGSGGTEYSWSTGATTSELTLTPSRTTTYTLTATRGGISDTDEITVTVINCDLNNNVITMGNDSKPSSVINPSEDIPALNKIEQKLRVYPNPTEGNVLIQTNSSSSSFYLVLLNLDGSIIHSEPIEPSQHGMVKELDLSNLAKGLYFMQLYNEQESYVEKIMVI